MPTYEVLKALSAGMRADGRSEVNREVMELVHNAKVSEYGVVKQTPWEAEIDNVTASVFPFPQVFRGEESIVAIGSDGFYSVNESLVGTKVPVYRAAVSASNVAPLLTSDVYTKGTGWTYNGTDDVYIKAAGGTGALSHDFTGAADAGEVFRIKLTISAVSAAGRFRVQLGTNISAYQDLDVGVFEWDIQASGDDSVFQILSDTAAGFTVSSIDARQFTEETFTFDATTEPFHFVDFKGIWFATNGTWFVFCAPTNLAAGAVGFPWKVLVVPSTTMKIGTVTRLKNRFYLSGFDATNTHYDSAEWLAIWDAWVKWHRSEVTHENYTIGGSVCFGSGMAGLDIYWPFSQELAMFGIPDATLASQASVFFHDALKKGLLTFFKWPYKGETLRVEPINENTLVGYGTDGVGAAMEIVDESGLSHDVKRISRIGLLSKGSLAVREDGHIFIDPKGKMHYIGQDLQPKRLNWSEFLGVMLEDLDTNKISLTVDPDEQDTYITNGLVAYVLSQTGLSSVTVFPTSIFETPDGTAGVGVTIGDNSTTRVITDKLDFGSRMMKTIHDVEMGYVHCDNVRMRIWYQHDDSEVWYASSWINVFQGGFTVPIISAFTFKIEVEYDAEAGYESRLSYINVNWQARDKRNFRAQQRRA
jgi:hypothetical protein